MKNENQNQIQETLRGELDERIATEAKAEFAVEQKASAAVAKGEELLIEAKERAAAIETRLAEIQAKVKIAEACDIQPLSKQKVQLDRDLVEVLEEVKNLSSVFLPSAEEALKTAQEARRVKVFLIMRDLRDLCTAKIQALAGPMEREISEWQKVCREIVQKYTVFAVKANWPYDDLENLRFRSPLLLKALDYDNRYKEILAPYDLSVSLTPFKNRSKFNILD